MNSRLAILLLLVVTATHYGYPLLCEAIPTLRGQEKGVFYVARGIEGAR